MSSRESGIGVDHRNSFFAGRVAEAAHHPDRGSDSGRPHAQAPGSLVAAPARFGTSPWRVSGLGLQP